jgi:dihydroneopterin aldolase
MAEEGNEVRGTLELEGLVLRLVLGALPEEKLSLRDVPLDISWTGEVAGGPAVDYAAVCEKLAVLQNRDYDYIEDVASDVLSLLSAEYPGGHWRVRVRKPFPPAALRIETASFSVENIDGH